MKSCIEELGRSHFQVFTDFQEVLHGRQGAAGRNGLDVTFVFAKVQAHLIFGYVFLIRSSVILSPINFLSISSTSVLNSLFDFKLFTSSELRNKIEILFIKMLILRNISVIYCYIHDRKKM